MYETQLLFVEELMRMDAKISLVSAHEVITFGPSFFNGTTLKAPNVLQSAHALILAGLAASGTTIIQDADIVYRRYPDLTERLAKIGAKIERVRK
jgi:UDP-N-acetylglucosamine 1-carboxyvinyltransferase